MTERPRAEKQLAAHVAEQKAAEAERAAALAALTAPS